MSVSEAGHWRDGEWLWDVQNWFYGEEEEEFFLIQMLLGLLVNVPMVQNEEDSFEWEPDKYGGFTVSSCAKEIKKRGAEQGVDSAVAAKLNLLWNLKAPSKVKIFVWRLILDRNPTRHQLKKKRILITPSDCCCVFCSSAEEDSNHLFVGCPVLEKVWEKIGVWIGTSISLSNLELRNYLAFFDKIKVLDERLTVGIIWMAVVWNFWIMRNAIVFRGCTFSFDECVSAIVLSSWKWFRAVNISSVYCNFHVWNILPLNCIKR
ncbi:uncharacterized protein LOC131622973 [Vicia villosa]|uniref:uncharacterized protein LOC131622973 n=1 Tax=Vicia villosa TaxID=3911 RepID=UPI00273CAA15|nr:uncharacterized protein LOC131622973 [Vicia villosa]